MEGFWDKTKIAIINNNNKTITTRRRNISQQEKIYLKNKYIFPQNNKNNSDNQH